MRESNPKSPYPEAFATVDRHRAQKSHPRDPYAIFSQVAPSQLHEELDCHQQYQHPNALTNPMVITSTRQHYIIPCAIVSNDRRALSTLVEIPLACDRRSSSGNFRVASFLEVSEQEPEKSDDGAASRQKSRHRHFISMPSGERHP